MHKTSEDGYKEWKPSGYYVLEVECPQCGRYRETWALKQEHIDGNPDILEVYGWTQKEFSFVGCHSTEDDNGCEDCEEYTCESCPHWGVAHCSNCGNTRFEFVRRCTPEDDAKNYANKCMYKCSLCGELLRAWNL